MVCVFVCQKHSAAYETNPKTSNQLNIFKKNNHIQTSNFQNSKIYKKKRTFKKRYVVYTALAWRNKAFGAAAEFAWGADSADFAVREAGSRVRLNFEFVLLYIYICAWCVRGRGGWRGGRVDQSKNSN